MTRARDAGRRVDNHPILGPQPEAEELTFTWNDTDVVARSGEPIAAALLAHGIRVLRRSERAGTSRGVYCNIGHCFECRVVVDGVRDVRACLTPAREGMRVNSQGAEPDVERCDEP